MQKSTVRNGSSKNGFLGSKILGKRLSLGESALMSGFWSKSMPKITKYMRRNWKPIAWTTTGVAAASIGSYFVMRNRKGGKHSSQQANSGKSLSSKRSAAS